MFDWRKLRPSKICSGHDHQVNLRSSRCTAMAETASGLHLGRAKHRRESLSPACPYLFKKPALATKVGYTSRSTHACARAHNHSRVLARSKSFEQTRFSQCTACLRHQLLACPLRVPPAQAMLVHRLFTLHHDFCASTKCLPKSTD